MAEGNESIGEVTQLGRRVTDYEGLECFKTPHGCSKVVLTSDEVTAVCPVTSQPDWYIVEVEYTPDKKCIESKTFKLFMGSFRNKGLFCEQLSCDIMEEVRKYAEPFSVRVSVVQKPRGGVSITAVSQAIRGS